ncbi:MAG TPA: hypothetical protein DCO93_04045 [Clostridiales bacterium]|nr:hypothetical protein [Clostridiales bacterium]
MIYVNRRALSIKRILYVLMAFSQFMGTMPFFLCQNNFAFLGRTVYIIDKCLHFILLFFVHKLCYNMIGKAYYRVKRFII